MRFLLGFVALAILSQPLPYPLPAGYRYPTASDRVDAWRSASQSDAGDAPYHAATDLEGDRIPDHAWILLAERGADWVVVVALSSQPNRGFIRLDGGRSQAQSLGLASVSPGTYQTLCGKRPATCEAGEPSQLQLREPALNVFQFEGASSYFWWDAALGRFVRTWMTD
jgi:hypothetical protein